MTHDEALAAAAQLLHAGEYAPVGAHAHINACANMAATYVAYARELRESGAMRPAAQPKPVAESKPSAGPWTRRPELAPGIWTRNLIHSGARVAIVTTHGWSVYGTGSALFTGPEGAPDGKRLADEAARRFYTLED